MTVAEMEMAVRQERAIIAELHEKISHPLKEHLQQATLWLDDVEGLFLDSAREERRTPAQLERWLSYGVAPLGWAIERRKRVEEILAKYGPDAETFGNG